jgi:hypothetical protein
MMDTKRRFHRRAQTLRLGIKQKKSGELWGRGAYNGKPPVLAFLDELPDHEEGTEFVTDVPFNTNGHPAWAYCISRRMTAIKPSGRIRGFRDPLLYMCGMQTKLRHSHIAVRIPFDDVAAHLGLDTEHGVDDMGRFRFGDVNLRDDSNRFIQKFRFASHEFDSMTHLLAEDIDSELELAFILYAAGVRNVAEISISKDRSGKPVRAVNKLYTLILAMAMEEDGRYSAASHQPSTHDMHYHR